MSRRSFVALLAALGLVCVLQSWAHLWEVLHESRLNTVIDLDRSNGLPDALSTVVIVAAAGGSAFLASRVTSRLRQLASALAGVLVLAAAADLLHLHPGASSIAEIATAVTAIAGLVLLLVLLLVDGGSGNRARVTLALGLLALASSLVVGDLPDLYHWFERARGDPVIEWQIVAKQGLELIGWWLVAMALWDAALRQRSSTPTER